MGEFLNKHLAENKNFEEKTEQQESSILEEEQNYQIELKEVRDLELPLKNILEQIREKLDSGYYGLLIGDDASGRIPALILKKVIDNIYSRHGYKKPDLKFFAGTGTEGLYLNEIENKVDDIISTLQKHHNDKLNTLLITEYLLTGRGMNILNTALSKAGNNIEIATIALTAKHEAVVKDHIPHPIHAGIKNDQSPALYGKYDISGVKKVHKAETFARPVGSNQGLIQARKDSENLAAKLTEWYEQKSEK